jgi:hypothetical protein
MAPAMVLKPVEHDHQTLVQAMTCQQCCRGEDSGAIELESYGGQRTSVPTIQDFDCGLVGTALQRLCPPC